MRFIFLTTKVELFFKNRKMQILQIPTLAYVFKNLKKSMVFSHASLGGQIFMGGSFFSDFINIYIFFYFLLIYFFLKFSKFYQKFKFFMIGLFPKMSFFQKKYLCAKFSPMISCVFCKACGKRAFPLKCPVILYYLYY